MASNLYQLPLFLREDDLSKKTNGFCPWCLAKSFVRLEWDKVFFHGLETIIPCQDLDVSHSHFISLLDPTPPSHVRCSDNCWYPTKTTCSFMLSLLLCVCLFRKPLFATLISSCCSFVSIISPNVHFGIKWCLGMNQPTSSFIHQKAPFYGTICHTHEWPRKNITQQEAPGQLCLPWSK